MNTSRTEEPSRDFSIVGEVDEPCRLACEECRLLPSEQVTVLVHCVTKWSKPATVRVIVLNAMSLRTVTGGRA